MARFVRESESEPSCNMPWSWQVSGMKVLKKPDLQAKGQWRSTMPFDRVQATTDCANSPVKDVCLGTMTTECLTLALALEMEEPMTKN